MMKVSTYMVKAYLDMIHVLNNMVKLYQDMLKYDKVPLDIIYIDVFNDMVTVLLCGHGKCLPDKSIIWHGNSSPGQGISPWYDTIYLDI
jgi:hypothetical protein